MKSMYGVCLDCDRTHSDKRCPDCGSWQKKLFNLPIKESDATYKSKTMSINQQLIGLRG